LNDKGKDLSMSIKKSMLALAVAAFAAMGLASSATAATDGVVRDVTNNAIIPNGTVQHAVGWAKYVNEENESVECHATSNLTSTGTEGKTGHTTFEVPDVSKCTTSGSLLGPCTVVSVTPTNGPYHVTVTPTDFDVTGTIVIHTDFDGPFCLVDETTLTFSAITLTPTKTGNRAVTGTTIKLGATAAAGDPIAGVHLEGSGEVHIKNVFGGETTEPVTATGELAVTGTNTCTWKLAAS
jgi:hypothetical protein